MSYEANTQPVNLERYGWLSLATGVVVFTMKIAAWAVTGSVGLLSDALESTVNIAAAIVAILALRTANRPADANHPFGHGKVEYLSAMFEGVMILFAATAIVVTSVQRLIDPQPLQQVGLGLVISVVASLLNGSVAVLLIRVGRTHRSAVLVADGKHLMTDVWTSAGVVLGVAAVALTGWERLDPLIALAVAANIVITGWVLVRSSASHLMDEPLPRGEIDEIRTVLRGYRSPSLQFHGLQTRAAGRQRFVSLHVLVPGATSVQDAHDLADELERSLSDRLGGAIVTTHLEPLEDPKSWDDIPEAEHPVD